MVHIPVSQAPPMTTWQLSMTPSPQTAPTAHGLDRGIGWLTADVGSQLGPTGKLVGSRSSGKRPLPPAPAPAPDAPPLAPLPDETSFVDFDAPHDSEPAATASVSSETPDLDPPIATNQSKSRATQEPAKAVESARFHSFANTPEPAAAQTVPPAQGRRCVVAPCTCS
jgi:hypothetical protein